MREKDDMEWYPIEGTFSDIDWDDDNWAIKYLDLDCKDPCIVFGKLLHGQLYCYDNNPDDHRSFLIPLHLANCLRALLAGSLEFGRLSMKRDIKELLDIKDAR